MPRLLAATDFFFWTLKNVISVSVEPPRLGLYIALDPVIRKSGSLLSALIALQALTIH